MIVLVDLGIATLIFAIGFLLFKAALGLNKKENKKDEQ